MAQSVAFHVKPYSIPTKMFVNTDHTGIYLIPRSGARIWAKRGLKHGVIHGMEENRQITVSVSSSANDNLVPFQVVFIGLKENVH